MGLPLWPFRHWDRCLSAALRTFFLVGKRVFCFSICLLIAASNVFCWFSGTSVPNVVQFTNHRSPDNFSTPSTTLQRRLSGLSNCSWSSIACATSQIDIAFASGAALRNSRSISWYRHALVVAKRKAMLSFEAMRWRDCTLHEAFAASEMHSEGHKHETCSTTGKSS